MLTQSVACDGCGGNLTSTSNCENYRLALTVESIPVDPKAKYVTSLLVYSPLDRTYHFCGVGCLDRWRDERNKANVPH